MTTTYGIALHKDIDRLIAAHVQSKQELRSAAVCRKRLCDLRVNADPLKSELGMWLTRVPLRYRTSLAYAMTARQHIKFFALRHLVATQISNGQFNKAIDDLSGVQLNAASDALVCALKKVKVEMTE